MLLNKFNLEEEYKNKLINFIPLNLVVSFIINLFLLILFYYYFILNLFVSFNFLIYTILLVFYFNFFSFCFGFVLNLDILLLKGIA